MGNKMYSNIPRSVVYQQNLLDFIRDKYGIIATGFKQANRGYFGETWRLDAADGRYFIKLDYSEPHKIIYMNSFPIIQHLCEHGIDCISTIIKTIDGQLYSLFDAAVLGVFEWVDGDNVQDERTKIPEYQMLAKVYTVPPDGLSIPREDFAVKSADLFYAQREKLKNCQTDATVAGILCLFEEHHDKIEHRHKRLKLFSDRCQADMTHFYITHGDAGGNIIMNGDKFTIVDWDDPVLAPPERDAWFCLYWDWAMDAFNTALRRNGIDYTMRPERLDYYCYHSFFWYLTEYLEAYFEIGNSGGDMCATLANYMSGWIKEELKFADTI